MSTPELPRFPIRLADVADAAAVAALAEKTFRDTFASTNTVADMDLHCSSRYGEMIQARELADPAMLTLICEIEGRPIAYSQLRWAAPPPCVSATCPGEIQRFYVDATWHGKGVAAPLMQRCLTEISRRHSDVAWLGVWERNPKAIAFYQKFGFSEVGSYVFPLGTDPQRDIIMSRRMNDSTQTADRS